MNNADFVLPNGLQMQGYIDLVGGQVPTNGQLLIGDSTNNRYSIGYLASENCLTVTNNAGGILITSNATNDNSANTIVSRDANGNFIASTITATLAGNAATATKLYTPQTINGIGFDGSQPITLTTSVIPEGTNLYFTDARAAAAAPIQTVFGRTGNIELLSSDMVTAWGTQAANTFLASPSSTSGSVGFRGLAASDLPLATTSAPGAVEISNGLTVSNGVLTANVLTVAGRTGNVVLSVSDVSGAAPLASPVFTGVPAAPTAANGTNSTQIATTAFVNNILASPTAIGTNTPNSGAFTTLSTTGLATLNSMTTSLATISGGSINGTPIGNNTPSTGVFTSLVANNMQMNNPISYSTQTMVASGTASAEIVMLNSGVTTVTLPSLSGAKCILINNTGSSVTVGVVSGWSLNFVQNATMTLGPQSVVDFVGMSNSWFSINGTYGA